MTSVEGSGSSIGGPSSQINGELRLGFPDRLGGWVSANEVVDALHGYRRPWWKGRGRQLEAPTPQCTEDSESNFLIDSQAGAANRRPRPLHRGCRYPRRMSRDLGGGVRVTDWQP
ncbi:hypothetical protein CDL15_Pgr009210 [Punica granatum]|uniref:Uncharacterized protein n=1 Tax=Punica granatum TaxID=22663 RepID=A0A218WV32_PUNGR|nr:hypothetical protein CDL15_Pgr009210 [Punica granatum]PKI48580.1 hypothetical protein CRG98_030999 [Punica granatum]